jgi:GT2 family glycosyltransferase
VPNTLRVYDCMDHHEGFGQVPDQIIEIEKTMLCKSDMVVVTSNWLEIFARKYNQCVLLIRNACDYQHFASLPMEVYVDSGKRKIIGYYGAIAEWFDLEIVRAIAMELPDALILLIGNDTVKAKDALNDLPNVEFTGEISYSRLPFYLYAFDVCLLPFRVMPLTLATNPVKIYEYLAAGKPVISVDLPEISQFDGLVYRASTKDHFVSLVRHCLNFSESESIGQIRKKFASEQTWDHRVDVLRDAVERISLPKISVVVLTYNNLNYTVACLNSLLGFCDYPNKEIIVVDNASTDETPSYLLALREQHPEITIVLNDNNTGFAAGNNIGLKSATGDYLVLLNNDTLVTPGWLLTMLRHLQMDSSIGLIGPVTNNIGNEAKIDIRYSSYKDMLSQSLAYTAAHMGKTIPLRTAAFFCVMMPRKVFEQVGPLDENFGRGFFEDDDYCRRIEELGLRIICAEDVFVHHQLSASFNRLGTAEKQALFEQNKSYYESKWGTWVPHEYR